MSAVAPSESATERPDRRTPMGDEHRGKTFVPREPQPYMTGKLPGGKTFDYASTGIDPEYLTGAWNAKGYMEIDHAKWLGICAMGGIVGSCRACGAMLVAEYPVEHDGHFDYTAHCRRPIEDVYDAETRTRTIGGCGYEFVAPRGRVLIRSSRLSERMSAVSKRRNGASDDVSNGVT